MSCRIGELSGWFYQLSTGNIKKNGLDFKKLAGQYFQLFLYKLKEDRLSAGRRGLAERICPFVEG
jgi:hypothetical protein